MSNHDDFDRLVAKRQQISHDLAEIERQKAEDQIQQMARIVEYGRYVAQLLVGANIRPPKKIVQIKRGRFAGLTKSGQLGEGWDLGSFSDYDSDYATWQGRSHGYVLQASGDVRAYIVGNDIYTSGLQRKLLSDELPVDQLFAPLRADQNARFEGWNVEQALADLVAQSLSDRENK